MNLLWLFCITLAGAHLGCGTPVRSDPSYPPESILEDDNYYNWSDYGTGTPLYAVPAFILVVATIGLIFGCTWCYKHKDCKPDHAGESQLFTANVSLHDTLSHRSQPPDSGFSEQMTSNSGEDNNNGPISLREMQNIANNNASAYIASEIEEQGPNIRAESRESVVHFEPLPADIGAALPAPLAKCSDWFGRPNEISRNRLQYLRELGRGWFGRVVEGEIEPEQNGTRGTNVAVKIFDQSMSLGEKVQFLDKNKIYRDLSHENLLTFVNQCTLNEPWLLIFELCSMDLHQYLIANRSKMTQLNEKGLPLRLLNDIAAGLAYIHSQGYIYGNLWSGGVLIRNSNDDYESARAILGNYDDSMPPSDAWTAPEMRHSPDYTTNSEIWSFGTVIWEVCSWGDSPTSTVSQPYLPEPTLPCPYRVYLCQTMQLCWHLDPYHRPTADQVYALLNHLYTGHQEMNEISKDNGYTSNDFEQRWQRLKPNSIPKVDEHVAIVHIPSQFISCNFAESDTLPDSLSLGMNMAVSRSSSMTSDKEFLSVLIKSESLTNLHGSLEDVRNIYLMHRDNSTTLANQQQNSILDIRHDQDNLESCNMQKVDPWLKDVVKGSQDDITYYQDVSEVIKNLDNILNSEKTSSSGSSQQASPSRENLTLPNKGNALQSNLVKSPGISNFQNILDIPAEDLEDMPMKSYDHKSEVGVDQEIIGILNHSFHRHSEFISDCNNIEEPVEKLDNDVFETSNLDTSINNSEKSTADDYECRTSLDNTIKQFNPHGVDHSSNNVIPKLKDLCFYSVNHSVVSLNKLLEKDCNGVRSEIKETRIDASKLEFELPKQNEELQFNNLHESIPSTHDVHKLPVENYSQMSILGDKDDDNVNDSLGFKKDDIRSDFSRNKLDEDITVYIDLTNETDKKFLISDFKDITGPCLSLSHVDFENCNSTVYLDLPDMINVTNKLINSERMFSNHDVSIYTPKIHNEVIKSGQDCNICTHLSDIKTPENIHQNIVSSLNTYVSTSTPKHEVIALCSDGIICADLSEVLTPENMSDLIVTTLEQQIKPENKSPLESPSKSQPTDTFDENSSVVLGPFELSDVTGTKSNNCHCDNDLLQNEEILGFSLNFSELNLETPSPLQDGNFLYQVPDVDMNEIANNSHDNTGETNDINDTYTEICPAPNHEKSPSTPPNSPGNYLAISNYNCLIVDTDNINHIDEDIRGNQLQREIELNQIELNITTKMAMAENENNMNIEYAGPLTIEEIDNESAVGIPELYFAGNGYVETPPEVENDRLNLDELRSELEQKLPLAQCATCEPIVELHVYSSELPPPPELTVHYPGALSPIAEETRQQLSAYESDRLWYTSNRTDSSESYLEPCNNSSDEVTDLPTAMHTCTKDDETYTICSIPSLDKTFTIQKDLSCSKQLSMSADSLNSKTAESVNDTKSPSTNNLSGNNTQENLLDCERISQVSPYILTSTNSSLLDKVTPAETETSTISKTTLPTDAKSSKLSETQCMSKATTIDSWCSNDTLFNVEDNFDDLAMDPDLPTRNHDEENSDSTGTLNNSIEKDLSHCSTYIVHNSKSDEFNNFTPDSITEHISNGNIENVKNCTTSPIVIIKLDVNDSFQKSTHTEDLAYETLTTGLPFHLTSQSNCTTNIFSHIEDPWKLYQPVEMVMRSPTEEVLNISLDCSNFPEDQINDYETLKNKRKQSLLKSDSTDISPFRDNAVDFDNQFDNNKEINSKTNSYKSPDYCKSLPQSLTSTPLIVQREVDVFDISDVSLNNDLKRDQRNQSPDFISFLKSAEVRPQELLNTNSKIVPHGNENLDFKRESCECLPRELGTKLDVPKTEKIFDLTRTPPFSEFKYSVVDIEKYSQDSVNSVQKDETTGYSDFKQLATFTPQNSLQQWQSLSSDFISFENSVQSKPQDLSNNKINSLYDKVDNTTDHKFNNEPVKEHIATGKDVELQKAGFNDCLKSNDTDLEIPIDLEELINEESYSHSKASNDSNYINISNYISKENVHLIRFESDGNRTYTFHTDPQQYMPNVINSTTADNRNVIKLDDTNVKNSTPAKLNGDIEMPSMHLEITEKYSNNYNLSPSQSANEKNTEINNETVCETRDNDIISSDALIIETVDISNHQTKIVDNLMEGKDSANITEKYSNNYELSPSLSVNKENKEFNNVTVCKAKDNDIINSDSLIIETEEISNHQTKIVDNLMEDIDCAEIIEKYPSNYELSPSQSTNKENTEFNNETVFKAQDNIILSSDALFIETEEISNHQTKIVDNLMEGKDFTEVTEKYPSNYELSPSQSANKENTEFNNETVGKARDNGILSSDALISETEEILNQSETVDTSMECKEDTKDEVMSLAVNKNSDEVSKIQTTKELQIISNDFLQHEKSYSDLDSYLPLITGGLICTSANEENELNNYIADRDVNSALKILKDWDTESEDSQSTNSSSGEFIWKCNDDKDSETNEQLPSSEYINGTNGSGGAAEEAPSESGSGSGSEGDEVEFVPSSWDCLAAPSKSSLRSLEQAQPDSKKKVVFKRQKYHCVYEYPREVCDPDGESFPSPYLPDYSTYSDWDAAAAEDAELGYGQLFGSHPLEFNALRSGISFVSDYDDDFFISTSARPFESLGILSTSSQFFPGMHLKSGAILEQQDNLEDEDELPSSPSPLQTNLISQIRVSSLDFTTPDSGVEDITPGSVTADDEFREKKLLTSEVPNSWRFTDTGSSSESVSPSSPASESLGGLRHTRNRLKLDLPPSPHLHSPRQNKVFNFCLEKPKARQRPNPETDQEQSQTMTPLVMTDETPIVATSLVVQKENENPLPEPTFSTFGKICHKNDSVQKTIVLSDDVKDTESEPTVSSKDDPENVKLVEGAKGEGTVLDSGDEDSGIESSAKTTLERNKNAHNIL